MNLLFQIDESIPSCPAQDRWMKAFTTRLALNINFSSESPVSDESVYGTPCSPAQDSGLPILGSSPCHPHPLCQ